MDTHTVELIAQSAIDAAGFGRFNLKVALLGALIYFNVAFTVMSTGFVLPAAACDFQMTTIDKGYIIAAPLLGTCFGPLVWGFLADLKGRKTSLLVALFMQGNSEFLMSFTPSYWCFLFLKFLSGFASIGQLSLLFTYVGEFQTTTLRKRILSFMDAALIVGMIIVPLLAQSVIPMKFQFRNEYLLFRSWNLFVMLCSMPAILIGFWLIFLPETPKQLAESGQYFKLLNVLGNIYVTNTNNPVVMYFEKLSKDNNPYVRDLVATHGQKLMAEETELQKGLKMKKILQDFKKQAKYVAKAPYCQRTILACVSTFCMTSAHYALLLWFPEIFQRFAQFETQFPNETTSVCTVSKRLYSVNATITNINSDPFGCDSEIHSSVYINSLWQAVACIPFSILLPMFVDRLGFKFFLVTASLIGFLSTVGLFFTRNSLENLILTCIFEAMTSVCMSTMFCFLVVIFPTNVRVFASTVAVIFSRIGSLVGNAVFSYLIDDYCAPLIFTVAAQLFIGAGFALMIQVRKPSSYVAT